MVWLFLGAAAVGNVGVLLLIRIIAVPLTYCDGGCGWRGGGGRVTWGRQ